jgi:hypothetical protein
MLNTRQLEMMYQQWIQGNEEYVHRWFEFVAMAAKQLSATQEEVMKELQKTYWFVKPDNE